jgi:replicative DNA helicase
MLLPRNMEAERSCLGCALVHLPAADYIRDHLTPDAFFGRQHQDIFTAIRNLRDERKTPDFITLKGELTRLKRLDQVGGPAYISSLVDGIPRATNVEYYAGILKDLQAKRALIEFSEHTINLVAGGDHNSDAILADADRRLLELQAGHVESRMRPMTETTRELFADIEWRVEHKGELTGVETGYPSINELTQGWQPGDLIVVAARPSIGKTILVTNSAVHAARSLRPGTDRTRRVAIFSLEMRRKQLEFRILSQLSGVAATRIMTGYLGAPDYPRIAEALNIQGNLTIDINDKAGQSAIDVRAQCRRMKGDGELDMVIIDYVQLMPGTLERRGATRNEEITDISRRLKDLADEVSAPVILVSQLRRVDGRPKIDDLRESGSLEQAADVVILLHRKNHAASGTTECILAKQRNGPTGTVHLTVDRDTVTFTDGGEPEPESQEEKQAERKKYAKRGAMRKKGGGMYDAPPDS